MDANETLELIASLSVAVAKEFKGKFPDHILEAFTLAGKYATMAGLTKEERADAERVSRAEFCPLCFLHADQQCEGCILRRDDDWTGCGHQYDALKYALRAGTSMDILFNLSSLVRRALHPDKEIL